MTRIRLVHILTALTVLLVVIATWRDSRTVETPIGSTLPLVQSTTRNELLQTVSRMETRLREKPRDGDAVVRLADTLIRLQRVNSDAQAVITAERYLRAFLAKRPDHYEAQRVLGAVLLSQHRFRDALREAEKARAMNPRDAFNYGVIGDAYLELGDYEEAFAAFDRMGALRPGPPAYARVAYALELKGDLDGALESMRMAADGTSAHDAEGQAWHYTQLGNLWLQRGRLDAARHEFDRALFTFPNHPYALSGLARVKIAEGDLRAALALYQQMFQQTQTPEIAAMIGDLNKRLGEAANAESYYVLAERLERDGWASEEPQPQALARFLAGRDRNIPEAVRLAEEAAAVRRDVNTMDALAWAYFKAGRTADAWRAAQTALRTGTRDPRILYHAALILQAHGDRAGSKQLLDRIEAPAVEVLLGVS